MPLSNDLAALIGFACESILWGVNVTLFITALITLQWPHSRRFHNPITYLNSLVFVCCTAHFALEFNHFYTTLNATGINDYANETTQLAGANYLLSFTDFLGDLILIYRCWIIWDKNYCLVLLLLITVVGGLASTTAVIILQFGINPASPTLTPLTLARYILPLCTHVLVTSLIVWRIWNYFRTVSNVLGPSHGEQFRRTMMLIIESGALYFLFQITFVLLIAVGNGAEVILAGMAAQIYGIVPTLIVIRVGLGISFEGVTNIPRGPVVMSTHIKWLIGQDREAHRVMNWDPEVPPRSTSIRWTESHEVTGEAVSLHSLG